MLVPRSMKFRFAALFCFCMLVFLSACGGRGAKTTDQTVAEDPPLSKKYENVLVMDLESTPEVEKDYPEAAKECQSNIISTLLMKNTFKSVKPGPASAAEAGNSLLIKGKIKEMRIVSTAARIWAGAMAGSSYMNIELQLIDVGTKQEIRKKEINSQNNAFAAAWTSGSSDHTLPADMGKIIAEYITAVSPKS